MVQLHSKILRVLEIGLYNLLHNTLFCTVIVAFPIVQLEHSVLWFVGLKGSTHIRQSQVTKWIPKGLELFL